jgi:hypothetical protein
LLSVAQRRLRGPPRAGSAYKELCNSVASVAALASKKIWSKRIIPLVVESYIGSADDGLQRLNSAVLLHALVNDNRSGDVVRGRIKDVIAVVWIGKHDSDKKVRHEFAEVFVALGAPSAVSLYQEEILSALVSTIESTRSWTVRRQCFRALPPFVSACQESSASSPPPVLLQRAAALVLAEAQKPLMWKGKGSCLEALAAMVQVCVQDVDFVTKALQALCEELTRKVPNRSAKYLSAAGEGRLGGGDLR